MRGVNELSEEQKPKALSDMTAAEIDALATAKDKAHKLEMNTLRALARAKAAQEAAK